jgi:hypothetical protein
MVSVGPGMCATRWQLRGAARRRRADAVRAPQVRLLCAGQACLGGPAASTTAPTHEQEASAIALRCFHSVQKGRWGARTYSWTQRGDAMLPTASAGRASCRST